MNTDGDAELKYVAGNFLSDTRSKVQALMYVLKIPFWSTPDLFRPKNILTGLLVCGRNEWISPVKGIRCKLWNVKCQIQKKNYKSKKVKKYVDFAAHVWAGRMDTAERSFSPVIGIQSSVKYVTGI